MEKGTSTKLDLLVAPKTDVELFEKLKELILKEWNKKVDFKIRAKGLRMVFRSKEISDFLINHLKLSFGEGKCEKVKIPEIILKDWNLAKYVIWDYGYRWNNVCF